MKGIVEFRNTYSVTRDTVGLVAMEDGDVRTRIYETDGSVFSAQPVTSIIEEACLKGGSSLAGRRTYVKHMLGFKYRRPVPVNEKGSIYAFPLPGGRDGENSWFFYSHVLRAEMDKYDRGVYLVFRHGERVKVNASLYHAKQQILKAGRCQTMMETREVPV